MKKNQAITEKINTNKKKKFLYFDWIVLVLFVLSILSNILLFVSRPELMNPVSTLLFQLWHLIFGIYFAVRITTISLMDKTAEVQKSIAKTAIRQIRNTQFMTENLIGIVSSKIDSFKNDKMIDTLKEINSHLSSLSINITSSESAFRDILGEEFKEEHLLWAQIKDSVGLLNEKGKEERNLRKKKEKEDKARQSELKNEIKELSNRISTDISSLPITSFARGTSRDISSYISLPDFSNIEIPVVGKTHALWDLTTPFYRKEVSSEEIGEIEQKENKEQKQKKKTTKKTKK